jgi:hypothetical protein
MKAAGPAVDLNQPCMHLIRTVDVGSTTRTIGGGDCS